MTVRTKLNSIIIISISAIVAFYIYVLKITYDIEKQLDRVERLSQFKEEVSTLNLMMEYYFSTQNKRYATNIDSLFLKLESSTNQIAGFRDINIVHQSIPSLENAFQLIYKVYETDSLYQDKEKREELLNRSKILIRSDLSQLLSLSYMVSSEHYKEIRNLQVKRRLDYAFMIFPVILFLAIMGYTMRKQILRSLNKLKNGAKTIASGNLDKRIELKQGDEFGELAVQFNLMADQIKVVIENERALSDQIKMQSQELKSSNEELEKFAYVASHDLQEPLRMIDSFLTLLESKYSSQLDDKAKQYIYYSVDGAKRMRQIILDLLEFSRAGSFSGELEEINLEEVMEEIKHLQSKVIEEKSATITHEALPILIAMNSPVLQIFHNLIGNALKYSQKTVPPKIHICSERKGNFWNFCVKDNGIGISKEHQERIFVIFQRLHGKTEYSGTGLGLSIVKKIIEKMEGNIWVESEGVGKGSSFYFQIPLKWVKIDD